MQNAKTKKIIGTVSFEDALREFANYSKENKELLDRVKKINDLIDDVVLARESQGLSQRDLAMKCGIKQPMIARFEKAEMMPRLDTFYRIISALDLNVILTYEMPNDFEPLMLNWNDYLDNSYNDIPEEVIYNETNKQFELSCQA